MSAQPDEADKKKKRRRGRRKAKGPVDKPTSKRATLGVLLLFSEREVEAIRAPDSLLQDDSFLDAFVKWTEDAVVARKLMNLRFDDTQARAIGVPRELLEPLHKDWRTLRYDKSSRGRSPADLSNPFNTLSMNDAFRMLTDELAVLPPTAWAHWWNVYIALSKRNLKSLGYTGKARRYSEELLVPLLTRDAVRIVLDTNETVHQLLTSNALRLLNVGTPSEHGPDPYAGMSSTRMRRLLADEIVDELEEGGSNPWTTVGNRCAAHSQWVADRYAALDADGQQRVARVILLSQATAYLYNWYLNQLDQWFDKADTPWLNIADIAELSPERRARLGWEDGVWPESGPVLTRSLLQPGTRRILANNGIDARNKVFSGQAYNAEDDLITIVIDEARKEMPVHSLLFNAQHAWNHVTFRDEDGNQQPVPRYAVHMAQPMDSTTAVANIIGAVDNYFVGDVHDPHADDAEEDLWARAVFSGALYAPGQYTEAEVELLRGMGIEQVPADTMYKVFRTPDKVVSRFVKADDEEDVLFNDDTTLVREGRARDNFTFDTTMTAQQLGLWRVQLDHWPSFMCEKLLRRNNEMGTTPVSEFEEFRPGVKRPRAKKSTGDDDDDQGLGATLEAATSAQEVAQALLAVFDRMMYDLPDDEGAFFELLTQVTLASAELPALDRVFLLVHKTSRQLSQKEKDASNMPKTWHTFDHAGGVNATQPILRVGLTLLDGTGDDRYGLHAVIAAFALSQLVKPTKQATVDALMAYPLQQRVELMVFLDRVDKLTHYMLRRHELEDVVRAMARRANSIRPGTYPSLWRWMRDTTNFKYGHLSLYHSDGKRDLWDGAFTVSSGHKIFPGVPAMAALRSIVQVLSENLDDMTRDEVTEAIADTRALDKDAPSDEPQAIKARRAVLLSKLETALRVIDNEAELDEAGRTAVLDIALYGQRLIVAFFCVMSSVKKQTAQAGDTRHVVVDAAGRQILDHWNSGECMVHISDTHDEQVVALIKQHDELQARADALLIDGMDTDDVTVSERPLSAVIDMWGTGVANAVDAFIDEAFKWYIEVARLSHTLNDAYPESRPSLIYSDADLAVREQFYKQVAGIEDAGEADQDVGGESDDLARLVRDEDEEDDEEDDEFIVYSADEGDEDDEGFKSADEDGDEDDEGSEEEEEEEEEEEDVEGKLGSDEWTIVQ